MNTTTTYTDRTVSRSIFRIRLWAAPEGGPRWDSFRVTISDALGTSYTERLGDHAAAREFANRAYSLIGSIARSNELNPQELADWTMEDLNPDVFDEGPTCSICDGLGHGYPGGGPCPLEDRGWGDD